MHQAVDINARAAQQAVIDAEKKIKSFEMAQMARQEKAKNAINFILLPYQTADGVKRVEPDDTPECQAARASCYTWLKEYFAADSPSEQGLSVRLAFDGLTPESMVL